MPEKGVVKSFNFEGLQYFVDQDIRICIKPERGHCNIQFEAEANQFMISVKLFSRGNFFSQKLRVIIFRVDLRTSLTNTDT